MAIVVSIKTQKGGEGKTTLTVNLAAFLAAKGKRVAVVDMDAQGHFSLSLAMNRNGKPVEGVFNVLVNELPLEQFIFPIPEDEYSGVAVKEGGCVHLLPGGVNTALAGIQMQLAGSDYGIFKRHLIDPLAAQYDVILIDNEPTAGLWLGAILFASDYVLIPSQMAVLSLDGAKQIALQMRNLTRLHNAQILGVVPMMTTPRTKEHAKQLEAAKAMFPGKVWEGEGLTYSTVWKSASDYARGILSYAPDHQAASQLWALGERFLSEAGL